MSIFHGRGYRYGPFNPDMIWDPFRDFPTGVPTLTHPPTVNAWSVQNWETPEAHVFQADLQGLEDNEVSVEIGADYVLRISGEKKVTKVERGDTWHRVDRSSGKFLRRYKLPNNARLDQTKASMENGLLTVIVPKTETSDTHPFIRTIHIN